MPVARAAKHAADGAAQGSGYGTAGDALAAHFNVLEAIRHELELIRRGNELEPDFDQTYLLGNGNISADVVGYIGLPRTLKHVEVTMNVAAPNSNAIVAVFDGELQLTQAQAQHNKSGLTAAASNAICTAGSGNVTARDYLGGAGILTVYFLVSVAGPVYASVRVRSLDKTQTRERRT